MPWAIDIYTPDGATLRRTLTPSGPVDSIAWSVRGDGDCLEGVITGRGLDIRAREIVIIRAKSRPTDAGQPPVRYVGWVVEVPATRAPGLTTCKLIGGRKRLTEILTRNYSLGGSVDSAAWAAAGNLNTLNNPRLVRRVPAFPAQGFTVGSRYPVLETLAETLEAFAGMVPGFTVEPGSTYTYNGRTYQPGDEVPPTLYGVRPEAADGGRAYVYFERPNPTPALLSELSDGLTLDWRPRESETVIDDVTIVVLETHNADSTAISAPDAYPYYVSNLMPPVLRRVKHEGARYGAEIRIGAEGEGLKTSSFTQGVSASTGWSNAAAAFDGNLGTYASNQGVWPITLARPAVPAAIVWRVRYSSYIAVNVEVRRTAGPTTTHHYWSLPSTNGQQVDRYLHSPPYEGANGIATIQFSADPGTYDADVIRIYEATPYEIDTTILDRIALAHMRLPSSAPAVTARVPNRLLNPAWRWQLTLADGNSVTGVAEQIDYAISSEEGLTTHLHLEQALTPTETATRALLDTKIRQAVRAGVKPTA